MAGHILPVRWTKSVYLNQWTIGWHKQWQEVLSEQKQVASCREANWGKIYRCSKLDLIWRVPEMYYADTAQNSHSSFFIKAQGSFTFKKIEKYWCG